MASGKTYADPDTADALITARTRPRRGQNGSGEVANPPPTGIAAQLTGCELEVLHMIGHAQTTHAIAATLHRSIKTIETYRSRICKKLGVDTTQMIQLAWQLAHGLGVGAVNR